MVATAKREFTGTNRFKLGIFAATERITIFGTVSVPLMHPILAAKEMATVDHVGRGRFGLNIVCGWNQDEFEMPSRPIFARKCCRASSS